MAVAKYKLRFASFFFSAYVLLSERRGAILHFLFIGDELKKLPEFQAAALRHKGLCTFNRKTLFPKCPSVKAGCLSFLAALRQESPDVIKAYFKNSLFTL